jgi:hypothetical protein
MQEANRREYQYERDQEKTRNTRLICSIWEWHAGIALCGEEAHILWEEST